MQAELQETQSLSRPGERQLTQMDIMVEQAMRVEGLSGAERLALIDKIEGVYLRRKKDEAEEAFNTAMNEAQKAMEQIPAESLNPHTRSHYAKYAAVDKVIRPIYTDYGFALIFRQGEGAPPDCIRLICRVSHSKGHVEHPFLDLPVDGKGAQGKDVMTKTHATGSGVSYGKRYLAGMIFNLAFTEDDNDGNAVVGTVTEAQVKELRKLFDKLSLARQRKALEYLKLEIPESEPLGTALENLPARGYNNAIKALATALRTEGETGPISRDQEATLTALIEGVGGSCKADFLKTNRIKKVGDLPANQYQAALTALNQQRRS